MKLKGKFKNLKTGAKRVFVGMLILCILSSATGIGSILAQATEDGEPVVHTASSEWSHNDSTHWHVCTVEGCQEHKYDEGGHDYNHSFSYTPNNNGTHNVTGTCECGATSNLGPAECSYVDGVCTYCGASEVVEPTNTNVDFTSNTDTQPHTHTMGEWTESEGMHIRTCTDENCEYTETHAPGGDTTETCTICNPDLLNTNTLDTNSLELFGDVSPLSLLGTSQVTTTNASNGPVKFEDLYIEIPDPADGLVYNGSEQTLFKSMYSSDCFNNWRVPGKMRSFNELKTLYGISQISLITDETTCNGQMIDFTRMTRTDAGNYTVTITFRIYIGDENYKVSQTFNCSIAKASFKDSISFYPETDNYLSLYESEPYYDLVFNNNILNGRKLYSSEYTYSMSKQFSTIPTVGESVDITFKSASANFDDSTVTKTVKVKLKPTYDGSETQKSTYYKSVLVQAPEYYYVLGSDNEWASSYRFYKVPDDGYLYFKNSDVSKSNKIKIPVNFTITDGTSDTYIEYLFTTLPKFHETLTYTGSDLTLTSTAPVLKSAEELAQLNVKNNIISWWFVDKNGISLKEGILPTAINPGVYRYTFKVEYLNSINDNTYILTGADYYTTILKDIGHSDITYNARCSDYQSLDEDIFLTQFYTVKDKEKDLEILEQYEVSFSPDAEYYETGTDITLTYKGITNAGLDTLEDSRSLYTGTVTKKIPVSTIDVKLNGAAQVSKYDDAVVFTAEGYTISDSATGTFDTEYTYSTPCDNIDLPLYFKKNGRVVKQTIKGLTIGNAAGIRLLYDGSSELKPLYHDSVRISADGYTVSATQTGTFSDNYVLSYDASKNMTPVDTFSLYFKDKSTGGVYQKNISGINLAETPGTVTVLYNGASQKEWYNANVTITGTEAGTTNKCTISDSKDGTYTSNYVMTGSGLVSKKLYFKNSAGTVLNDGNPYTIVVNIDKTAPTGTITLNGATSSSFKSTDSTVGYANSSQKASISASDDVSGVETIKYYASETFYSSSSDLIAGMSEKSGAWRTYSS
ncbi:MAG: hypothetical protein J5959_11280, partial [Butyrivibrio sp.]|nr:hypothetical protein [Butyrivibrio sp.]